MYFRKDYDWWDPSDDSTNALLRRIINPIRFAYFTRVSRERLGEPKPGQRILEVGSGGGFLAEEFARIGFDVTGIDPAERSILSARAHARESTSGSTIARVMGRLCPSRAVRSISSRAATCSSTSTT
jgi:2-polyprenyl-6-hydroxyphenyl methylase/3-demethylubiquinone-9 3-methyltransferase